MPFYSNIRTPFTYRGMPFYVSYYGNYHAEFWFMSQGKIVELTHTLLDLFYNHIVCRGFAFDWITVCLLLCSVG